MDEANNLIDSHIEKLREPIMPNAKTVKTIGGIGTSSNPITAINDWIKNKYDRNDVDQVM